MTNQNLLASKPLQNFDLFITPVRIFYLSKAKDCSPEVLAVLLLLQLLSIPLKAKREESSSTILLTKSSRPVMRGTT